MKLDKETQGVLKDTSKAAWIRNNNRRKSEQREEHQRCGEHNVRNESTTPTFNRVVGIFECPDCFSYLDKKMGVCNVCR